jgi:hypothetical protein
MIEAMKMALETLEDVDGTPVCNETDFLNLSKEITALRAAIESQERVMKLRQDIIAHHLALADGINAELAMQRLTDVQQEMEAPRVNQCAEVCERAKLCAICARGLEEMEQEPVAWKVAGEVSNWSKDFSAYQTKTYVEPVYTHPPRREWVGLTDEEIEKEFGFIDELLRDCVHRTEAKLKEKNS